MGVVAYRHVTDKYIAVFRHFIPPGIWEAVYVIEALLGAGLSVKPDTEHSDTQGQSATVFAFTNLLGIQFMPRIRNWKALTFISQLELPQEVTIKATTGLRSDSRSAVM